MNKNEMINRAVDSFNKKTKIDFSKYHYLVATMAKEFASTVCFFQAVKPEKLLLIVTPETADVVGNFFEVINKYHLIKFNDLIWRECNSTDMPSIYKQILEFCSDKQSEHMLFDTPCGKKTMTSAAVMAATFLNVDIAYCDYEKYDWENHCAVPETAYGLILQNPYSTFGHLEINKAKNLMKRNDFNGAVLCLKSLEERVSDIGEIRNIRILAESLHSMDNFFFEDARKSFKMLFSKNDRLHKIYNELQEMVTVLSRQDDKQHSLYELVHFFFTGKRYALNGKHDLGIFLMFRVVERYAQFRLKELNIDTAKVESSVFTIAFLCLSR